MLFSRLLLAEALTAAVSFPQDEAALRRAFEGKTVILKVDMPATQMGVDVYPTAEVSVDSRKVEDRLKQYGIGVHQGDSITVTRVVVKKDHIEFHLGGGGFGTFSDNLAVSSSVPTASYEYKSDREKDLEQQLKYENDSYQRDREQQELERLRRDRNRDNAYASSVNLQAQHEKEAKERDMRAHSGSRFNIWYKGGFPAGATTPESVMGVLSRYVEFRDRPGGSWGDSSSAVDEPKPASSGNEIASLRKGMTIVQVEKILGPAAKVDQHREGSVDLMTREYASDGGLLVSTQFAGGVLIDFNVKPR